MSRYFKRLTSLTVVVAAAAALAVASYASAGQSVPSATGGWTSSDGRGYTLESKVHPNGTASGKVKVRIGDLRIEGEVTCLSVVGNRAFISGVPTRVDTAPFLEGPDWTFVMIVTDNGEGKDSGDAHTSIFIMPTAFIETVFGPDACTTAFFQGFLDFVIFADPIRHQDVVHGDIQVRG